MTNHTSSDIPIRVGRLEGGLDAQDDIIRETRVELLQFRESLLEINSKLSSITYDAALTSSRVEGVSKQLDELAGVLAKLSREEDSRKLTYKVGAGVVAVLTAIGTSVLTLTSYWPQIKGFLRSLL